MENNKNLSANNNGRPAWKNNPVLLAAFCSFPAVLLAVICALFTAYMVSRLPDDHTPSERYAAVAEAYKYNAVELRVLSTYGSAFVYTVIGDELYMFTNRHVVETAITEDDPSMICARFYGKNAYYDAGHIELVGYNSEYDIALLKTKTFPKHPYVDLRNQDRIVPAATKGAELLCLGNNLGFGIQAQNGIVSGDSIVKTIYSNVIAVVGACIPLNQGNSGAAVFDLNGRLVGMNTWRVDYVNDDSNSKPVDNTCFLTPAPIVAAAFENLVDRETLGQETTFPLVSMTIHNVTYGRLYITDMQTSLAFDDFKLKVERVDSLLTPLEVGDIIKKFGNAEIVSCNFPSVLGELFMHSPVGDGEPLTLVIERGGKELTVRFDKLKRAA